jgi:hypothetical protein
MQPEDDRREQTKEGGDDHRAGATEHGHHEGKERASQPRAGQVIGI